MQISAKQEMIFQLVGPDNPIVSPGAVRCDAGEAGRGRRLGIPRPFNRPELVQQQMQGKAQQPPQLDPRHRPKSRRCRPTRSRQAKAMEDAKIKREQMMLDHQLKQQEMQMRLQLQRGRA